MLHSFNFFYHIFSYLKKLQIKKMRNVPFRHILFFFNYKFSPLIDCQSKIYLFLSDGLLQWSSRLILTYPGCPLNHNVIFMDINYSDLKFIMVFD